MDERTMKTIGNLIYDQTRLMRDLLAGYLDCLIESSRYAASWKDHFATLAESKAGTAHGDVYQKAHKALLDDREGFSSRDMDVTLLTALLIYDLPPQRKGRDEGCPLFLSDTPVPTAVRSWARALRDNKNNYLSHEDGHDDGWTVWKRVISCHVDMERFVKAVEREHPPSAPFLQFTRSWNAAFQERESAIAEVYDLSRRDSIIDIELELAADSIMAAPDRDREYCETKGRIMGHPTSDKEVRLRCLEREQRLDHILADKGYVPAQARFGTSLAQGPIRDGKVAPADYRGAVYYLTKPKIEELDFGSLRELANIMSDPDKCPVDYRGTRGRRLYDRCTELAPERTRMRLGWPPWRWEN